MAHVSRGCFRDLLLGLAVFSLAMPAVARADSLIGFEAGANFANYSTSPSVAGLSSKTGVLFGVFGDTELVNELYLEVGLRYIQEGYNYSAPDTLGGTITGSSSAGFLDVPVLAKAKFSLDPITPYVFAGPDIGFKLSETDSFQDSLVGAYTESSAFNSVDFMLDFGAGAEVDLGDSVNLFAQFRYSLGMVNVANFSDSMANTRGAQISAGLSLGI